VGLTVSACGDLLETSEFFENRRSVGRRTVGPTCLFALFVHKTNEFSTLQGNEQGIANAKIEARK
jgi:hypothetical protein